MTRICQQIPPSLSSVRTLKIEAFFQSPALGNNENIAQWLDLFRVFNRVEQLGIVGDASASFACALQRISVEMAADLLPALREIYLGSATSESRKAVTSFIEKRNLAGLPDVKFTSRFALFSATPKPTSQSPMVNLQRPPVLTETSTSYNMPSYDSWKASRIASEWYPRMESAISKRWFVLIRPVDVLDGIVESPREGLCRETPAHMSGARLGRNKTARTRVSATADDEIASARGSQPRSRWTSVKLKPANSICAEDCTYNRGWCTPSYVPERRREKREEESERHTGIQSPSGAYTRVSPPIGRLHLPQKEGERECNGNQYASESL
ncbi:hypothetical protein EDB83DRAFT_2588095 [Lactarius deliciosus]|nr:hypothetical protein EDB83DRAFT_2588095 [Lactarius deliciosus]